MLLLFQSFEEVFNALRDSNLKKLKEVTESDMKSAFAFKLNYVCLVYNSNNTLVQTIVSSNISYKLDDAKDFSQISTGFISQICVCLTYLDIIILL